jgi:hypothetical protein
VSDGKGRKYWPTIDGLKRANQLMYFGAGVALLNSLLSLGLSIARILSGHPALGMSVWNVYWSLADAAIFAVVAWRVYRLSLARAIAGLVLFTAEKVLVFTIRPSAVSVFGTILFWFIYLHAVRGGLYLRKAMKTTAAEASPIPTAVG